MLENELKRIGDALEELVSLFKGKECAPLIGTTEKAEEAPPKEETPKKTAKKKAAKAKPAEEKEETPKKTEVDRPKVLGGIVDFIKEALTNAEDSGPIQEKVTELRAKYGVELVGDLADDQLEDFDRDIRAALS